MYTSKYTDQLSPSEQRSPVRWSADNLSKGKDSGFCLPDKALLQGPTWSPNKPVDQETARVNICARQMTV